MNSPNSDYPSNLRLKEALPILYAKLGQGDDGGVNARWIKVYFGKFYVPIPNFPARKKAVRFHDVHHILTGYPTTWKGETEIGAWEVATGGGTYIATWIFDLGIFATGLFLHPVATFRAFVKGLRSKSFYNDEYTYEEVLEMTIGEAQSLLKITPPNQSPATITDVLSFIGWWLLAFISSFLIYVAPVAFIIHCIVD